MEKKYCIFFDFDGTLLSDKYEQTREIIQKVRGRGHKVFINTGRPKDFLPKELDIVNDFDGVIISNGGHIIINGEEAFRHKIKKKTVLDAFCVLKKCCNSIIFEGGKKLINYELNPTETERSIGISTASELEKQLEKYDIIKILYIGDISAYIDKLPKSLKVVKMDGHGEIHDKLHSKRTGMEFVCKHFDIENTIAFGDSMNDYEMVSFANIGIAMENGSEELKSISNQFCEEAAKDGIGKKLEDLINCGEL